MRGHLALVLFSCGSFVLACAGSTGSVTGYTDSVQRWVGQDANALVRTWGPPASTFTMASGNTLYVYVDSTEIPTEKQLDCSYDPGRRKESCTLSGGEVIELGCTTAFEVENQRVTFARAEGTLCLRAPEPPPSAALPAVVEPAVVEPATLTGGPATPAQVSATPPSAATAPAEAPQGANPTRRELRKRARGQ